jgi:LAGLIDADG DNA endonuclease family
MSLWGLIIKPQMFNLYLFLLICCAAFGVAFGVALISPIAALAAGVCEINLKNGVHWNRTSRLRGIYRIGPHNKEVLSIIFGSLLGDAHAEKRLNGMGTRISFFQEDSHVEYILFLHKMLSEYGYCNSKKPVIGKRLGSKGKLRKIVRFTT